MPLLLSVAETLLELLLVLLTNGDLKSEITNESLMKVHKGNYRRKVRNSDCGITTPQNNLASKVTTFWRGKSYVKAIPTRSKRACCRKVRGAVSHQNLTNDLSVLVLVLHPQ